MLGALRPLVLAPLLVALAACGDDHSLHVDPADYDQHCATDTDCVLVSAGGCGCTAQTATVNSDDAARYEADYAAAYRNVCPGYSGPACGAPAPVTTFCDPSGHCAVRAAN